MKLQQVAAQLYTLRDHLKTPADIATTLKKVRAIGYTTVQVSGMGPIPEADLLALCQDTGLVICATHEGGQSILETPERVVDRLNALECQYTAYPSPGGVDLASLPSVMQLANGLNAAGKVLHEAGKVLCYHNHQLEFRKLEGRTVLETIYAETDPRYLQGEPDTYWVQNGGGDSAAWCHRLRGRLPLIHLKDYGVGTENQPVYTEIGNGNLDFPGIIAAAEHAGCQWFIVEQDTTPGDPFDSLAVSYRYIAEHLVS